MDKIIKDIKSILLEELGDEFMVNSETDSEVSWNIGKDYHITVTWTSGKLEVRVNRESWCVSQNSYDHDKAACEIRKLISKRPLEFLSKRLLGTVNPDLLYKTGKLSKLRLEFDADSGKLGIAVKMKDGKTKIYEL